MTTENESVFHPECYKRHAVIDNHIEEGKGWRATIVTIVIAIFIQIGAFLVMWGGLTTTVKKNNEYIWQDMTPKLNENTRNVDRLIAKLEDIKFIAVQGEQGKQGIQGRQGIQGEPGKNQYEH